MDNYRSEWVLAKLKRYYSVLARGSKDSEIYYKPEMANHILTKIAQFESDSVLGEPVTFEFDRVVDLNASTNLPGGDIECDDCRIDVEGVEHE